MNSDTGIDFKMDLLLAYAMDGDVREVKSLLDTTVTLDLETQFYLIGSSIRRYLVDNRKRENLIEIINYVLDQDYVNIDILIDNTDDMIGKRIVEELQEFKIKRRNNLIDKII